MSEFSNDPLVSVGWLAERLNAPDLRIVDASWFLPTENKDASALYLEKRIPGAIFFDIDEIKDNDTDLPHMMPSPEKFASRVRKMGIGDGARVVVYDAQGIFSAARVWWMFRAMGHEDVCVLDGGLPAWEAAGHDTDFGPPQAKQDRHFTPRYRADLVRDVADVQFAVDKGRPLIIDARPAARFRGEAPEPRPGVRSGHVPGAINVPAASLLTADKTMKSREELERMFAETGVTAKTRVMCMCGSGVTAAIVALALARIGRWDAPIYDGSWAEWGAREDLPLRTGEA